eukprot:s3253_g8.t1
MREPQTQRCLFLLQCSETQIRSAEKRLRAQLHLCATPRTERARPAAALLRSLRFAMGYDPVQRSLQWKRRVDQEELALCQRFLAVSRGSHEGGEESSCIELSDDAWRTAGLPSLPVTPARSMCSALISLGFRQTLDMDAEGSCSSTSSVLSKPSRLSTSSASSCPWTPRCFSERKPDNLLKKQHGDFNSQPGHKQPRSQFLSKSRCS